MGNITLYLDQITTEQEVPSPDDPSVMIKEAVALAAEMEGSEVVIRNPRLMSWGYAKRLNRERARIGAIENEDERRVEQLTLSAELITKMVISWNLTDQDVPDSPVLPIPSEDAEALDKIPLIAFSAISVGISQEQEKLAVPKAK